MEQTGGGGVEELDVGALFLHFTGREIWIPVNETIRNKIPADSCGYSCLLSLSSLILPPLHL